MTAAIPELPVKTIFRTWWPLSASWLLMAIELPALAAVVARLPDAEINLAAYGGIIFPIALIIEAPIIMLLAASTALSKDLASYQLVRRYMLVAGALLSLIHILVAFTPLYYVVVERVFSVPAEIVEPARIGLMIMTPWTWSIAYRRFNQGVLIRFGRSHTVGIGTVVRLSANFIVLTVGYLHGAIPGVVVATSAVIAGVVSEAIYSGIVVRPVQKNDLRLAPPVQPALTWKAFYAFYNPLVLTSLLVLLANPIGSAALSRMPDALASLAAWPVISGIIFMFRSMGIAFNEVVVALLDRPHSSHNLRRFAAWLAVLTTCGLFLMASTPLSVLWFQTISGLPAHLVDLARAGLWLALPLPALSVYQSWFQGAILHGRRTTGLTESVIIYLVTSAAVLGFGIAWGKITGFYVGLAALTLSVVLQTAWLWLRAQPIVEQLTRRDDHAAIAAPLNIAET